MNETKGIEKMLREGIARAGIADIERTATLMETYIRELELFNAVRDFVGTASKEELVVRHILDSLAPYRLIAERAAGFAAQHPGRKALIADIGSGAGFPGIPLAVALPDADFVLAERMSRRCSFLENCKAVMKLTNVSVENVEAERLAEGRFDVAVFRAFRPLENTMIRTLLRVLNQDGVLAAYKGKISKIEEEMTAINAIAPVWSAEEVSVPFLEEERHLVFIPRAQTT